MVRGLGNQNRSGEIANFQTEVPQKQPILASGSYAAASSPWEVDRSTVSPNMVEPEWNLVGEPEPSGGGGGTAYMVAEACLCWVQQRKFLR